jgi:hypothetical protein
MTDRSLLGVGTVLAACAVAAPVASAADVMPPDGRYTGYTTQHRLIAFSVTAGGTRVQDVRGSVRTTCDNKGGHESSWFWIAKHGVPLVVTSPAWRAWQVSWKGPRSNGNGRTDVAVVGNLHMAPDPNHPPPHYVWAGGGVIDHFTVRYAHKTCRSGRIEFSISAWHAP